MKKTIILLLISVMFLISCSGRVPVENIVLSADDYVIQEVKEEAPVFWTALTLESSYMGSVESSDDGNIIAASDYNSSISLFDTSSWRMIQRLTNADMNYLAVALSSDGNAVATIAEDEDDYWYVEVFERGHNGAYALVFSERLGEAYYSSHAEIISCKGGFVFTFKHHLGGNTIFPLVRRDGGWSCLQNRCIYTEADSINLLYCSPDMEHIFYNRDGEIVSSRYAGSGPFGSPMWNELVVGDVDGPIKACRPTPDGKQLIVAEANSESIKLHYYDIKRQRLASQEVIPTNNFNVYEVALSKDCMLLATRAYLFGEDIISLYDKVDDEWVCIFSYESEIDSLFFLNDHDAYGVLDNQIVTFNASSTAGIVSDDLLLKGEYYDVLVSPDGNTVAIGNLSDDTSILWSWDGSQWSESEVDCKIYNMILANGGIWGNEHTNEMVYPDGRVVSFTYAIRAISPNAKYVIAKAEDDLVVMQQTDGGEWIERSRIEGKGEIYRIDYPDAHIFAFYDGKAVLVYDYDGNKIDEVSVKGIDSGYYYLSMSPDGNVIALNEYANEKGGLRIYEKGEDGWSGVVIRHGDDTEDDNKSFDSSTNVLVTDSHQVLIGDLSGTSTILTFTKLNGEWKVTGMEDFHIHRIGDTWASSRNGSVIVGSNPIREEVEIIRK